MENAARGNRRSRGIQSWRLGCHNIYILKYFDKMFVETNIMTISYSRLFDLLKKRGLNKTALRIGASISTVTLARLSSNKEVSLNVLGRICDFLNCKIEDVCEFIPDKQIAPLLLRLTQEMEAGTKGGIYHQFQIVMTYNSNHIEGSKLTEEETRYIFETFSLLGEEGKLVPLNDVLETIHHFACIKYVLAHALEPLSEAHIKELHRMLKEGTKDAALSYFRVGEYKALPNAARNLRLATPSETPARMKSLLSSYAKLEAPTFADIVDFHAKFESIHPFQDGNGRVGRLIMLKECLKNGFLPVIIDEELKLFYYRGLSEYDEKPGYLISTCEAGQDKMHILCQYFQVE